MSSETMFGRLALRHEGDFWNAYYAPHSDSMKDAMLIGSIMIGAVIGCPERMSAFVAVMGDALGELVKSATGYTATWGDPEMAPEYERAGRA